MEAIIDTAIRNIVREEFAAMSADILGEPELITIADFVSGYGVAESVVYELHRNRAANGFPSVQLGPRTIRIDKTRLKAWFANGGLGVNV